jgi:glycogen phosphorylase
MGGRARAPLHPDGTGMSSSQPSDGGRRSTRVDALKRAITDHVTYTLARDPSKAKERDVYLSTAWAVRDRLAERWLATKMRYRQEDAKRVYYLSLEFLMGRTLLNALVNLDLDHTAAEALHELSYELEELRAQEPDAGLGNGGLGRLAACYLDSMASMGIPGYGYGIRYEYGIFRQKIVDGRQVELPDNWLQLENPWEIARPDRSYKVRFYGRVDTRVDADGRSHFAWVDTSDVVAMAYDTPIPGYRNHTVNTLRLWSARATEEFDLSYFIRGDYLAAVQAKAQSETISKVLYPPDDTGSGKELRLKQQYFFVSATLQDILKRYKTERKGFDDLPDKVQIQLNDTHPAVAIPELLRLLVDEEGMEWNEGWRLTRRCFAYTNHTVLPEALESWGQELFGRLLPRHLELIREIDRRFREKVAAKFPDEPQRVERMAILSEGMVRMANLAIVGSHTTNGVAALHSQILRERMFRDFHELWPERLTSVTNGVTQRRWMRKANPPLAELITEAIGDGWITDLERISELEPYAEDRAFRLRWEEVKADRKGILAGMVERETGVRIDPRSLIDAHIKRMHEYKRQSLNVLRLADHFLRLRDAPHADAVPRSVVFGGKAAPTYWTAKLIIKLINAVAEAVNADPQVNRRLRAVFIPDYRVTLAEVIIPGSDLSVQISTAGFEASGTGNMKLSLNGALTIGTMDGASIEIVDRVGRENAFIFGLTAEEVIARREAGYDPRIEVERSPRLRRVLDFISSGELTPDEPGLFTPFVEGLLHDDRYMVFADFDAYLEAQERAEEVYRQPEQWTRMSILNVARCGFFSSDRSIGEYAERIWKL